MSNVSVEYLVLRDNVEYSRLTAHLCSFCARVSMGRS